jgi:hypothetical protein
MYNLVWQSVICRPGKLLILLVRKNRMLRLTAPTARRRLSVPWGKRARRGGSLTSVRLRPPPSAYPGAILHLDCRWPLILIVARHGRLGSNRWGMLGLIQPPLTVGSLSPSWVAWRNLRRASFGQGLGTVGFVPRPGESSLDASPN